MQDEKTMSAPSSGEPTADPLASLLSNPELIGRIKNLLQTPTETPLENTSPDVPSNIVSQERTSSVPSSDGAPSNPLGAFLGSGSTDGLSTILSNPSLMEKLPQVMAMLKPMLTASPSVQSVPTQAITSTSEPDRKATVSNDRDHLLLALKPFLSHERQEAVDAILRIAKLGALLKQIT